MSHYAHAKCLIAAFVLLTSHAIAHERPAESTAQQKNPPGLYEKQGYPKQQSAAMLDTEVRALLDTFLRYYREPGLFTHRANALSALGVQNTTRRWDEDKPVEGSHRAYVDTFAKEGLFARPAWSGEYSYRGKLEKWLDDWASRIQINVNYKQECIDSRAVEGYLDLVLDPGITQTTRPAPERMLFRHEVPFARPYAKPFTAGTSSLSLRFSHGCLVSIISANIFNLKDASDEKAHDQ